MKLNQTLQLNRLEKSACFKCLWGWVRAQVELTFSTDGDLEVAGQYRGGGRWTAVHVQSDRPSCGVYKVYSYRRHDAVLGWIHCCRLSHLKTTPKNLTFYFLPTEKYSNFLFSPNFIKHVIRQMSMSMSMVEKCSIIEYLSYDEFHCLYVLYVQLYAE